MKITAYKINAFAKTLNGGNEAGIVFNAGHLSEADMQKIAAAFGFSETAFVMKSAYADFKVRFFTPVQEVDLCGHATVGTYCAMAELGRINAGIYKQETKAGILNIEIKNDLTVMMEQLIPDYGEIIGKKEIADSLNISVDEISKDLPVQIISTGLRDIIVAVDKIGILDAIKPDFKKIENISRKYQAVGYHVFSLEIYGDANAHCRNFAPLCGIDEESATGTSSGALACYLYKYGKINAKQAGNIILEQGYSMDKPSEIIAALKIKDNKIIGVKVGGKSLKLSEIEAEI